MQKDDWTWAALILQPSDLNASKRQDSMFFLLHEFASIGTQKIDLLSQVPHVNQ